MNGSSRIVFVVGAILAGFTAMAAGASAQTCQPVLLAGEVIEGPLEAVVGSRWNGDTIELTMAGPLNGCTTIKVHVGGIDAPKYSDFDHVCGAANHSAEDIAAHRSTTYLKTILGFEELVQVNRIEAHPTERSGLIAFVSLSDGRDIGTEMIAANCAIPSPSQMETSDAPKAWCEQLTSWCALPDPGEKREARTE